MIYLQTQIGELDRVTLDSLYDQAVTRTTNQEGAYNFGQVSANPFEADYNQDPFYGSSNVTPLTDAQMAAMAQRQTFIMQQPPVAMDGYDSTNPYGNPFVEQSMPSHPPETSFGLI